MNEALLKEVPGAFMETLTRTNRKIRDDRALEIAEDARLKYRRKVEDLEMKKTQYERERRNMLDLSPTTADSLVLAADFDGGEFVEKDITLGIRIREVEIQLEIAHASYKRLFGSAQAVKIEDEPEHGGDAS